MPLLQLYLFTCFVLLLYWFIFGTKKTVKVLLRGVIFFAVYILIKHFLI